MRVFTALAILCFCAGASPVQAQNITGRIVGVHDGDTRTLLTPDKENLKVRLEGIDAPEAKQPFGAKAKAMLSDLAFGKTAEVSVTGKDRYGRTLGVVTVAGVNLNLALVRGGMAWRYDKYSKDAALLAAQSRAQAEKKGLWADENPVPPWEWRAMEKSRAE